MKHARISSVLKQQSHRHPAVKGVASPVREVGQQHSHSTLLPGGQDVGQGVKLHAAL